MSVCTIYKNSEGTFILNSEGRITLICTFRTADFLSLFSNVHLKNVIERTNFVNNSFEHHSDIICIASKINIRA